MNMDTCFAHFNDFVECQLNLWLWRTVPIVQLVFGTLGNGLNILILLRKRLQKYSSTVYLIFLAGADLCTLWTWTFSNIIFQGFGRDIRASSQFSCKIILFVTCTAGGYSMWLIVLLSIERMVLVRFPVFSKSNITRRSALITALACLGLIASPLSYVLFKYELKYNAMNSDNATAQKIICDSPSTEKHFRIILWLFFNLVPIALLLIGNGVIIVTIVVQRRRYCTVNPVERAHKYNIYRKTKSSTRMVLLISAFFISTIFPYTFFEAFKTPSVNKQTLARKILMESIFLFVIYCNYTFNFILYCVSGTVFRDELQTFVRETIQKISTILLFAEIRPSNTT